ncbi:MAG: DUF402 domain-containing protein [Pyrinomonadaceae bacterium]
MNLVVRSKDFDGSVRKSWPAEIAERNGSLLLLRGVFDAEVSHPHLGLVQAGTVSYEYYWLDRWYNVFRFHEPDGAYRGFYCNLNMPPILDGETLDYIDLEIDVLVDVTGNVLVIDEDEFEESRVRWSYPEELVENARNALKELFGMIERREFPFDYLDSLQQIS